MKVMTTGKTKVTMGFAEKDSPTFGFIKPLVQVACFAALTYFGADNFDKNEIQTIIFAFMAAFGIESINVATPKGRK